jgi:hypothetical protein
MKRIACTRIGISLILTMLFGLTAMFSLSARAQTVTGSIRGTVTDATGAVVPEAKVTATNNNTGVVTSTTTDRTGTYNLQSLRIGTYVVSAEKTGFKITADRPFALGSIRSRRST